MQFNPRQLHRQKIIRICVLSSLTTLMISCLLNGKWDWPILMNIIALAVLLVSTLFSLRLNLEGRSAIAKFRYPVFCAFLFYFWISLTLAYQSFSSAHPSEWMAWLVLAIICTAGSLASMSTSAGRVVPTFVIIGASVFIVVIILGMMSFRSPWTDLIALTNQNRLQAWFSNTNQLSSVFTISIPWLIVAWNILRSGKNRWGHLPVGAGLAIMLFALFLTRSRGAILSIGLGLLTSLIIWALARNKRNISIFLTIPAVACAGVTVWAYVQLGEYYLSCQIPAKGIERLARRLSGNPVSESIILDNLYMDDAKTESRETSSQLVELMSRLRRQQDRQRFFIREENSPDTGNTFLGRFSPDYLIHGRNTYRRVVALIACWYMWRDHPFFGIGPGNYSRYSHAYMVTIDRPLILSTHAHNLPMQMLAEMGIPGIVAWLCFVAMLAISFYKRSRERSSDRDYRADFLLGWAISAALIHNLVDITILYNPTKYIFPITLALYASAPYWSSRKRPVEGAHLSEPENLNER